MTRYAFPFVLAVTVCGPESAHHSRAIFSDEIISFQGEVVRFDWANPHVQNLEPLPNKCELEVAHRYPRRN